MSTRMYASLIGPMLGQYYPLPAEITPETEVVGRIMLNTSSLRSLWCAVYTEEKVDEAIKKYGGQKLPVEYAHRLDYDADEVNKFMEEHHIEWPKQPQEAEGEGEDNG